MEAAKRKLASLRVEREALTARLRVAPQPLSVEVLRDLAVERVLDLRRAFEGAPEESRSALRVLLDGERMRVYADADRAFRVEGVFRLALENGTARNLNDSGRFDCMVAGGAQRPRASVLPVPLSLPVVGRVEPRAA